jgi:hypothetical protein
MGASKTDWPFDLYFNFLELDEPSTLGCNWRILFLREINTGTWPVRLGSLKFQTAKYRGVGYMDVVEALLPYRNATNIFLQISKNVSYFKILINLRTYITYNKNIASFNVLHKLFMRIYELFSCWILAYETRLEANPVVLPPPSFFS